MRRKSWRVTSRVLRRAQSRLWTRAPLPSRSRIWPACRRGIISRRRLFDSNTDLRLRDAPGNLYSKPQKIHLDPAQGGDWKLELTEQIPAEQLPAETEQIKFVKIQSKLLSEFYGRPIFLRAGIVLPRDYARDPSRRYPLWVQHRRLERPLHQCPRAGWARIPSFRKTWQADDTPRLILLQLDGAGPNGDPYYVNSANNGPFGDALVQRTHPACRGQVPRRRPTARALPLRRFHRRLGLPGAPGLLSRLLQRHLVLLPRSGGLPRSPTR